jgi:hypothetical protein
MLKKTIAILLISVYLFNLAGYKIFFDYLIQQAYSSTIQELDKGNYTEAQLIEIKIPLNLPYYNSMDEYERYDGEIELNGIHYNFVKRKVFNDTLYMLCLPNHIKTEMHKAKNEFAVKETNNEPSSKKGMDSFEKKNNFEKEHKQELLQYNFAFTNLNSHTEYNYTFFLHSCFIASPVKPPEVAG